MINIDRLIDLKCLTVYSIAYIHKNKVKGKTCSYHIFIVSQTGIPTHHICRYSKSQCEANLPGDRTSAPQEN